MWLPARFLCCVVGFSPSLCVLAVPQSASPGIPVGSSVMFAPMGGFETYLTAAVREKKVPIVLTLDQNSAKYFVVSSETDWRRFVYGSPGSAASESAAGGAGRIMLIDAKTKDVVWAYELQKGAHASTSLDALSPREKRSIAEACAKHLKEFIEFIERAVETHGDSGWAEIITAPTPEKIQGNKSSASGAVSEPSPTPSPTPPQEPQSSQKIVIECHDPATNDSTLKPDEILLDGMACRVVTSQPPHSPVSLKPSPPQDDYILKLHITTVEMEQGNAGFHSPGYGGGSYYWHLFTGKIDGDPVTYKFSVFMKPAVLHIGYYSARWNKNGTLEVQYTDGDGKLQHETLRMEAEPKE